MNTELTRRLDVDNASLFARCCLDTHLFVYFDSCFWPPDAICSTYSPLAPFWSPPTSEGKKKILDSDAKIKKLSWTAELIVPCGVVT